MPKSKDRNGVRVRVVSDFICPDIWRVQISQTTTFTTTISVASYVGKGAYHRACAHAKRIRRTLKVLPAKQPMYNDAVASAVLNAMDAMSPQKRLELIRKLTARWA